jgi:hypothetical protein
MWLYWQRKIFLWLRIAEHNGDKNMHALMTKIAKANKSIVKCLITNYIIQIKEKYALAFF